MKTKTSSNFFIHALYTLAGCTLLAAILLLISALGYQSSMGMSLNVVTAALGPIFEVLVGMLTNAIHWLGILLAGIMVIVAVLLWVAGRITRHSQEISQRLIFLEKKVAELEKNSRNYPSD